MQRGRHSEKPDWQYELIEAYFPSLPKIELKARRARPGWDSWGLDAPSVPASDPETGEIATAAEAAE
jgi:N6-adenosine-specific RNA methylase IME4